MTLPKVLFSLEAQDDLFALQTYIADQSGRARAEVVVDRVLATVQTIASMPAMGGWRAFLSRGALAFSVPPWLVIYRPLPDLDGIEVIRVVDSRRDLGKIF
jgi:plasmid stabilization system protein ParE